MLHQTEQIPSDSDNDDPIAIRPSASPSKPRPPPSGSSIPKSAPQPPRPAYSTQYTSQNLQSPHDNLPTSVQRLASLNRPKASDAETPPSLASAVKHSSGRASLPEHVNPSVGRALPTSSNGSVSGSQRRFSAPTSSQSGRRVPKKRLSMQNGGESHAPFEDSLSSPSQDEMEEASRPIASGKGASRSTTFPLRRQRGHGPHIGRR